MRIQCNQNNKFNKRKEANVWVHDGKNTILSGHNRQNAGSIAGLTKGPVIIKENLTYEDAILIATETNLRQRSFDDLSPSEKAYCLKQHYDAIKSQGRRNDLIKEIEELVNPHEIGENGTWSEIRKKLNANEKVSEEYCLGKDKIAKYLRIASLISPLMELLDNRK
ncbi:parB domain protein nuclease [Firmicutes bacterium CAG:95]|jgi:ParB family chromosome partitioning protein|nr:parB domain protein nuclease [Firmicutes bacterium CAG:95]